MYGFGKNTHLVIAVLDFITSREFFRGVKKSNGYVNVLTDFKIAAEYAYYKVYGSIEYTWTDIRSYESSKIWSKIYDHQDSIDVQNKLSSLLGEISEKVQKKLTPPYNELLDDVTDDLSMCIKSRAIQGISNKFYENIFKAYKSGGWPCGWKGDWPDGELVIFYPPRK